MLVGMCVCVCVSMCAGVHAGVCYCQVVAGLKKKEQGRVFKETVAEKLKNKAKPF